MVVFRRLEKEVERRVVSCVVRVREVLEWWVLL